MYHLLEQDTMHEMELLGQILEQAQEHFDTRDQRCAAPRHTHIGLPSLPDAGLGAQKTLELFRNTYRDDLTASNGSRYFGFVIGGVTPAALAGDWLTSLYDQNAFGLAQTVDRDIEDQTVDFIRQMLGLGSSWFGCLCSGATMATFAAMSGARQWLGDRQGHSVGSQGLMGMTAVQIASGCAHASTYKVVSMLGMGRQNLTAVGCLPGREAVDLVRLEEYLTAHQGAPVVVIANLGTANSGDYDDLPSIVALKDRYDFYLHVDAAIMGVASCSPRYAPLYQGLECADSVTVDAHKWLNVPYDGALYLTRHKELVYQSLAQVEGEPGQPTEGAPLFNFTPEGSRRFRALPLWFSLMAYGREGYRQLIESNCDLTADLAARMIDTGYFRLLGEVRLNVICYTLNLPTCSAELVQSYLARLQDKGVTFSNSTNFYGTPAVRICLSNYLTTASDTQKALASMVEAARELMDGEGKA